MSSIGHLEGVMDFGDPHSECAYQPATAYHQALAAHPGVVYTDLFRTRPKLEQLLRTRPGYGRYLSG